MELVINQPKVRVEIPNNIAYLHEFKGQNISNKTIRLVNSHKGCSCTGIHCPETILPHENFVVTMVVDKIGQTGLFSVGASLEFDNEEKIKLNINGKLYEPESESF